MARGRAGERARGISCAGARWRKCAQARARERRSAGARELMCWGAMAHGPEARVRGRDAARCARPRGREGVRAPWRAGAPEPLVFSANSKIVEQKLFHFQIQLSV